MDKPTEFRLRFSSAQIETPYDYPLGSRLLFQGEGEITDERRKNIGKDGEYLSIKTILPILAEFKDCQGIYPSSSGEMTGKSLSKQLRDHLFIYWQQQLANKYPDFEKFYEVAMEKLINDVKEKIL